MRSNRAILSVQVTKVSGGVGAAVSGFLNYVQHRDHENSEGDEGLAGLVRYVAHRDVASAEGRLFDRDGQAGTKERKELVKYVRRSLVSQREGSQAGRAVYRMVLSPEDARGLDLRELTRKTMAQLERDIGAPLPLWIAAEHRNTAHPHVHIVMAARREIDSGRFREVRITKPRLARMKTAMSFELEAQRDSRQPYRSIEERLLEASIPRRRLERQHRQPRSRSGGGYRGVQRFFARMTAMNRHLQEQIDRERELERQMEERER